MSENHDALLYILRIAGFLFAVCCVWLIYARQKTKMKRLKAANQHSAIVLLHKRHAGNIDYASINAILHIDGLRAETFLYALGVPAVYLAPGKHVIEVEAHWSRHIRGRRMKDYQAGPSLISVSVESGEYWSLEYCISKDHFTFERCDPKNLFVRKAG
ncbi:MAG: hypothetical protein PUH97_02625 [Dialister sp.]|nr:hypothetical protein [Dialister sp.]MDY5379129.1 hypothetical protein [Dialister sp.]